MRLKHIKGADEKVFSHPMVITEPQKYHGKWQTVFQNNQPIEMEIGMGKGNFIIQKAKKNPQINYIGIEKYSSVLVKALDKITDPLPNLCFLCLDAKELPTLFDHEITKVYLNFSDPWPKKKHTKRRLTSDNFLSFYDDIMQTEKQIEQKTDNRHFFEYSLKSFTDYGYHIEEISLNLSEDEKEDNIETEYEEKWKKRMVPIYYVKVKK